MNRRLLILSCSQRKRPEMGLLPAIDRYDGPAFRVLRKFLTEHPEQAQLLSIFILSAEFGLIPGSEPIPDYDRRITPARARELQPTVHTVLRQALAALRPSQEILICMGQDYRRALDSWEKQRPPELTVRIATGLLGRMLSELRDWLYGTSLPTHPCTWQGVAHIRGINVQLTPEEVLDVARQALIAREGNPTNYQAWYVQVDDQRVAPKWLVSQLTGLPVRAFVTAEARRVLTQLGIEVMRA